MIDPKINLRISAHTNLELLSLASRIDAAWFWVFPNIVMITWSFPLWSLMAISLRMRVIMWSRLVGNSSSRAVGWKWLISAPYLSRPRLTAHCGRGWPVAMILIKSWSGSRLISASRSNVWQRLIRVCCCRPRRIIRSLCKVASSRAVISRKA